MNIKHVVCLCLTLHLLVTLFLFVVLSKYWFTVDANTPPPVINTSSFPNPSKEELVAIREDVNKLTTIIDKRLEELVDVLKVQSTTRDGESEPKSPPSSVTSPPQKKNNSGNSEPLKGQNSVQKDATDRTASLTDKSGKHN